MQKKSLLVLQGYGLTETSASGSFSLLEDPSS